MSENGISARLRRPRGIVPLVGGGIVLALLATMVISWIGCANHHVPPGHIGYVRSRPLFGAGKFINIVTGPDSTGYVWRQEVTTLDIRTRTFSEDMVIPTHNRLELSFRAHARIRLDPKRARDVVERFGGEDWYKNNVRDQFRATVRDRVQMLDVFEVKDKMRQIGDQALAALKKRYADTPIQVLSVDVGDITYPKRVVESVVKKFVTNEENERKDVELDIAQKQIQIGEEEAQGIADSQQIIRTTLDPMFLQFEALRAIEDMAGAPNTTFLMFPFSKTGNSPVIMLPTK